MALFNRRKISPAQRVAEAPVAARESMFAFDPRGPELAAQEAGQALQVGDSVRAFERAVKSVDRLHDFYVYQEFANRQPSAADDLLIDVLVNSLEQLSRDQPAASVKEGVMEATHRLRTISTSYEEIGGDSSRYRRGLDELARLAPDVDVSGVYWH
jgi:hypothetical protein